MLEIQVQTVNASKKTLAQLDNLSLDTVRKDYGKAWHTMVLGRVKAQAVYGKGYRQDQEFLLMQPKSGSAFLMHSYNQDAAKSLWDIIVI